MYGVTGDGARFHQCRGHPPDEQIELAIAPFTHFAGW